MEKLIELHNEYRTTVFWKKIREWEENDLWPIEILTSKNYGFIKRLVEHDKIDLLKLTCMNPRYTEILDSDFSWKERIIMILSIQDNPIEFLVSILK